MNQAALAVHSSKPIDNYVIVNKCEQYEFIIILTRN